MAQHNPPSTQPTENERLTGCHYLTGRPIEVIVTGGSIETIRELPASNDPGRSLDWISPGFFDLQINGFSGQEFTDPALTPAAVSQIARQLPGLGVTRFCPTVTTQAEETLLHALAVLADTHRQDAHFRQLNAGIHLEGPFISGEDGPRGAHPKSCCQPPDWPYFCRLQEAANGLIRLITLSPEYPESLRFIQRATESGVVVAIGHTRASTEQIQAAAEAGARLSTHLGNAAHAQIRRHPNYIWAQLAEDRLMASLIADGHHLPWEVLKCFLRCKTIENCILVSDMTGMGGMPPGRYETPLGAVEILEDGRLVIAGQSQLLAGAAHPIGQGVYNLIHHLNLPLACVIPMVVDHPATLFGDPPQSLAVGEQANLIRFQLDREQSCLQVQETFVGGSRWTT